MRYIAMRVAQEYQDILGDMHGADGLYSNKMQKNIRTLKKL